MRDVFVDKAMQLGTICGQARIRHMPEVFVDKTPKLGTICGQARIRHTA